MSFSIVRNIAKQLVMVFSIILILFAAYLSIGRQFMPAVSRYKSSVESQIAEVVGVPVTIDSLTGYFEGFNPVIAMEGFQLQVLEPNGTAASQGRALEFERASIILNMAQTIWQRQIVLEDFTIEGLDVNAQQREDGRWQLSGVNVDSSGTLDLDTAYETIQRVSQLQLTDLNIDLQSLAGNVTQLRNSNAVIQNSSGSHFIHINTSMNESDDEILLSVELTGNSLDTIAGLVHVSLPQDDYSTSSTNEAIGAVTLGNIVGGGHAWITIEQGQFVSASFQPTIQSLNFAVSGNTMLEFEDIAGITTLQRNLAGSDWEFAAENLEFTWNGNRWRESDSHLHFNDNGAIRIKAESVDLGMLSEIALESEAMSTRLTETLTGFRPRGSLRNLSVVYPLETDAGLNFELTANTDNVAVDAALGSPTMAGINGYVEVSHDFGNSLTGGFADVESENFSIRIPNVFLDTWDYDYVNGRLFFQVDMQNKRAIKLSSSMIVAESEIVDGRAQFSSNIVSVDDERVTQELSLLVGALRVDGSMKSPYLPNGPNIREGLKGTMEWLDGALLDAAAYNSGVMLNGSLIRGSDPNAKSFQAFFEFNQGQFDYVEEWPEISDANGTVIIDNTDIDIFVEKASSYNLAIADASGRVRRELNGDIWLTVTGDASGTTQNGLDFISVAPIGNTLGETIDGWQSSGNVFAELDLKIPLNIPSADVAIDVAATLQDNSLFLPEYQLQFDEVAGVINFDSVNGLQASDIESRFFDGIATISVSAVENETQNFVTEVTVNGSAEGTAIAAWPGQSNFVRDLLMRTDGEMNYSAQLAVQQNGAQEGTTQLTINSDLNGLELQLPQPFQKSPEQSLPLSLVLNFDDQGTRIQGALGSELTMRIALEESEIPNGIVYLGTVPGVSDPWSPRTTQPGLELRGNLDWLSVSEWINTFTSTEFVAMPSRDLSSVVSLVNLDIGTLDVFGELFNSVNVDIQDLDSTEYWTVGLISEAVTGSVLIPFDENEYIEAYLAFLHLQGSDEPEEETLEEGSELVDVDADNDEEEEEERIDVLAQVDPRNLPKFKFFTGDFSIGDRSYGLGQFTLDPTSDGAEFSDLIVNFRGLQAGTTETQDEPHFAWHYDGVNHSSTLSGYFVADDLSEILQANGYAASLESTDARFEANLTWPGSPAFFSADGLSGDLLLRVDEGRFLQGSGSAGALKLVSIINLNAIMRRARFSDDLLRSGLAFEQISGDLSLENGVVTINDRLVITGPSSVYQFAGTVDLANETIDAEMYVTLPVSDNIPWIGLLTANIPLAIGAYLFDQLFGDQVDSLTSAQYALTGPWEGLEPEFRQAFSNAGGEDSVEPPQ